MPSLSAITSSPMLKEFAQGAAQSAVQPVADFLAPTVEVPTSIGRYKIYTEKNRFLPPDTSRAIGGRATVLSFDATDATYNCQPNALDFHIDYLPLTMSLRRRLTPRCRRRRRHWGSRIFRRIR